MNDTKLNSISERIDTLTGDYNRQLNAITEAISKATAELEAYRQQMDEASLNEDLKRYTAARNARTDKETLIEMLRAKYDRIVAAGMVNDAESDAQIRELLDYEQELAADFRQAIAEPFRTLASLCMEYETLVQRTENTITRWTSEVHPNYRMDGKEVFDPETGKRTGISKTPVPVHSQPYRGCPEYIRLVGLLRDEVGDIVPNGVVLQ